MIGNFRSYLVNKKWGSLLKPKSYNGALSGIRIEFRAPSRQIAKKNKGTPLLMLTSQEYSYFPL